ncbi:unnamed protein product [Paramecium pentaurelia]|uniref:Uncharacterized protein n=1 Tax=Paramecium pentaurelia TaxID=43138 RepID=A0A8S1WL43_9CILI|nr:unnamed protein product [Paramecium pentaurelia]
MQGSFQVQEALADIFDQVKDVDEQIFNAILVILRKEKVQDCIGYLSESQILKQVENITQTDIEQILQMTYHDFNYKDFSSGENKESKLNLIQSIKDTIQFLEFLVHLTSIDNTLIQCGSNQLHILVQMKADLKNKNFENIKIQNTSLMGSNFVRCAISALICGAALPIGKTFITRGISDMVYSVKAAWKGLEINWGAWGKTK